MKTLVVDFSRVLIFPTADGVDSLNSLNSLNRLHRELSLAPGYNIFDHFTLNDELLEYLKQLKNDVYVFTDGKLHELPEISLHLTDIFKDIYSVEALAVDKRQPDAYITLAHHMGTSPSGIVFVDDKYVNIEAAKRAGIHGIQYTSNDVLIEELSTLL